MCESDEHYVPLNDGINWKGDPNATLSGQAIPQLPPEPAPRRRGAADRRRAEYDPATGSYIGPDGSRTPNRISPGRAERQDMADDVAATAGELINRARCEVRPTDTS